MKLDCSGLSGSYAGVKTIIPALSAVLLAVPCAFADEPDFKTLLEIGSKAVPFRDAWERCAAAVVERELESDSPAEAIADRAIRGCQRQESRLRAVLARTVGAEQAGTVVEQLRIEYRGTLTGIVDQIRQR